MDDVQLIHASAHNLPMLADKSVHCFVTSPPYFGLRRYEGAQDIEWPTVEYTPMPGLAAITVPAMTCPLGLEPDPTAFIGHLILCLREWHRILRDDGTCWVNLGSSYAGYHGNAQVADDDAPSNRPGYIENMRQSSANRNGFKPKDMIATPWMFAFAAQADGWYLRSAAPWVKRSAMPESVNDRPSSALEYVFLLAKQERYFYDSEAVKKTAAWPKDNRKPYAPGQVDNRGNGHDRGGGKTTNRDSSARNRRNTDWFYESLALVMAEPLGMITEDDGNPLAFDVNPAGFAGAHFATFAPALVEPMILSSTSERGCCPTCGAPWARVVERTNEVDASAKGSRFGKGKTGVNGNGRTQEGERYVKLATGWRPTCTCPPADPVPCVVCDPFSGSGTTGRVAITHNRRYIGVDLAETYLTDLAPARLEVQRELIGT